MNKGQFIGCYPCNSFNSTMGQLLKILMGAIQILPDTLLPYFRPPVPGVTCSDTGANLHTPTATV